jgi:hypothetical protein
VSRIKISKRWPASLGIIKLSVSQLAIGRLNLSKPIKLNLAPISGFSFSNYLHFHCLCYVVAATTAACFLLRAILSIIFFGLSRVDFKFIRASLTINYHYQYFLKDHLGSTWYYGFELYGEPTEQRSKTDLQDDTKYDRLISGQSDEQFNPPEWYY